MTKRNWSDDSMIGQKYYRLKIIKINKTNKNGDRELLCLCSCGNKTKLFNYNWNKKTKSCGCLDKESKYKHGKINTPLYKIWYGIKTRCNNKKCKSYKDYGGRGITYDPRWDKFLNFYKDMRFKYAFFSRKYRKELNDKNPLSIERKDVNGNYCFENCIFIPKNKQNCNKRNSLWRK